eukprot:206071-Pleurochrysis_carterae.AAC.2
MPGAHVYAMHLFDPAVQALSHCWYASHLSSHPCGTDAGPYTNFTMISAGLGRSFKRSRRTSP